MYTAEARLPDVLKTKVVAELVGESDVHCRPVIFDSFRPSVAGMTRSIGPALTFTTQLMCLAVFLNSARHLLDYVQNGSPTLCMNTPSIWKICT